MNSIVLGTVYTSGSNSLRSPNCLIHRGSADLHNIDMDNFNPLVSNSFLRARQTNYWDLNERNWIYPLISKCPNLFQELY